MQKFGCKQSDNNNIVAEDSKIENLSYIVSNTKEYNTNKSNHYNFVAEWTPMSFY